MKRLSIADAARQLGVTQEAICRRISKGELVACQTPDFRGYVWIPEPRLRKSQEQPGTANQSASFTEADCSEERNTVEGTNVVTLIQQITDLQERVAALEALQAETSRSQ